MVRSFEAAFKKAQKEKEREQVADNRHQVVTRPQTTADQDDAASHSSMFIRSMPSDVVQLVQKNTKVTPAKQKTESVGRKAIAKPAGPRTRFDQRKRGESESSASTTNTRNNAGVRRRGVSAPVAKSSSESVIKVSPRARFALVFDDPVAIPSVSRIEEAGRRTQLYKAACEDDREIVIGIDFGTSNIKAVIGDDALGKSFAVPFGSAAGIDKYLLPARVFESNAVYSLSGGEHCHRDLKLSFLATPDDWERSCRIVALLALVIRRSRGWLLVREL